MFLQGTKAQNTRISVIGNKSLKENLIPLTPKLELSIPERKFTKPLIKTIFINVHIHFDIAYIIYLSTL